MKNKKGSVLVFSLIMLSFVIVAALGMASTTLLDRKASIVTSNSTSALQLADTGIERFLQEIYQGVDQGENLDFLATALDPVGSCEKGKIDITIGAQTNRQSYTLIPQIDNGTNSSTDITNCQYILAGIERIKVIGHNKNTARALQIDLTDSLERGLLAYWNFEDNARAENDDVPGAPLALDASVYNHHMTLCPADQNGSGGTENIAFLPGCPHRGSETNKPDEGGMAHVDSWTDPREGIVDEDRKLINEDGTSAGVNHSEALEFKGVQTFDNNKQVGQYLMMDTTNRCGGARKSCIDELDQKNLEFEKDDPFSFSVWFKTSRQSGRQPQSRRQTILSRIDASKSESRGYDLYLENSRQLVFSLFNSDSRYLAVATNRAQLKNDTWHHAVVSYDGDANASTVEMYIDGQPVGTRVLRNSLSGSIVDQNIPFHIGRRYNTSATTVNGAAVVLDGDQYFKGLLDDIRVYDRELAPFEVAKLCRHGVSASENFPGKCPDPRNPVDFPELVPN